MATNSYNFMFKFLAVSGLFPLMLVHLPHQAFSSRSLSLGFGQPPEALCAAAVNLLGYKCQEFEATTDDGYILSVQRIPEGRDGGGGGPNRPSVLVQHGILVDGMSWLVNSPDESLPLILADNGFDVWISNTRGTRFSRRHLTLDPAKPEYWNWTWDDLVIHDLSTVADLIFNQTAQKFHYVGHSLGTLVALAAFSEGKLTERIQSAALLSPIAYLSHMTTALGVLAAKAFVGEAASILGLSEFNPKGKREGEFLEALCGNPEINCYDMLTAITGNNCCLNKSTIELVLKDEPQSTSTKNLVHLSQTVRDAKLSKYDYGSSRLNIRHYGSPDPPVYDLSKIPGDIPILLSYGGQDALSDVKDVEDLLDTLKLDRSLQVQYIKNYAHADFVLGICDLVPLSRLLPATMAADIISLISLAPLPPSLPLTFHKTCRFSARASPSPPLSHPQNPSQSPVLSSSSALQCPHFESCSGCTHEYNLHQPSILGEASDFFKKIGVADFTFESRRTWGWRCRAKLAVRGTSVRPSIGLYEEGTHNVLDIPECKAHHPSINAAVDLLKRGMFELNIEPYDEDQGTGELRYVQLAVTTYDTSLPFRERYKNGKVQVSLVWNSRDESSPSSENLNALANYLWMNGGPKNNVHLIHSVWANFQTSTNNIIFGNIWRHLLGEKEFWEHVGGIDISLAPSSFGQANTRAFDSLLHRLQKYVRIGASVVDLYAGAGVIGLSLAATRKCRSVKCVEVNKESKQSYEKTASRLPTTMDCSISWHHADASKEPLSWLLGSDVVIVDPPRKGLDSSLVSSLQSLPFMKLKNNTSESRKVKNEKRPWVLRERETSGQSLGKTMEAEGQSLPETLIYISCGWDSFKEIAAY
ncbi:hypothetical protein F511_03149 [Dorcoceras hygrometricum]|nr:hypothetical protein F511_03149 [Dorcoceras hygrometricum]